MVAGPAVTVVGAGLVGSLAAVTLQQAGYDVSIYERYDDIRSIPSLGRSINLVATSRGLRAVHSLGGGLAEELLAMSVPVSGRIVHHKDDSVAFQPYGKDDTEVINSISRYGLNKFLINKAEAAGVKLHFGHILNSADFTSRDDASVLTFSAGDKTVEVICPGPIFAADGAGSAVRRALGVAGLSTFTEELLDHTYKEVLFPKPEHPEDMPTRGLHIWPRGQHMIMGLANLDGSFTGTVYMPSKGAEESFEAISSREKGVEFLKQHYGSAVPLIGGMERALDQVVGNPEGILGTVRTDTWHHGGRVLLMGDASHAIVPFFGQGMNSGFEDCRVLAELLRAHAAAEAGPTQADFEKAFAAFQAERKPNTDAIADMALENYIEMRDSVGDKEFLLKKRVENMLEKKFEATFRSRYAMVCYGGAGNVTYANAQRLGKVQWELISRLTEGCATEADVDMDLARRLIAELVTPVVQELGMDLASVSH